MGIDATAPFGFESDFLGPVYLIEKATLDDFFTDDRIAHAKVRMTGWAHSLARTGR